MDQKSSKWFFAIYKTLTKINKCILEYFSVYKNNKVKREINGCRLRFTAFFLKIEGRG